MMQLEISPVLAIFGSGWRSMDFLLILLVASLQLLFLALLGKLLTRLVGQSASWMHHVWLSVIVLSLLLLPSHFTSWRWTLGVPLGSAMDTLSMTGEPSAVRQSTPSDDIHWNGRSATFSTSSPSASVGLPVASASQEPTPEFNTPASGDSDRIAAVPITKAEVSISSAPWLWMISALYLLIVLVMFARYGVRLLYLNRLARSGAALDPLATQLIVSLSLQLGLKRKIHVQAVNDLPMPLAFGCLRETILVPADFGSWSDQEQRAVALHELAHLKRRDVAWECLGHLMLAIYWFHPLSRYVLRQLRLSRELATDELVLAQGFDARHYAQSIVSVLTRLNPNVSHSSLEPAVAMSLYGDMESRLSRILTGDRAPLPRGLRWLVASLLLMVTGLTSFRLEANAAPNGELIAADLIEETDAPAVTLQDKDVPTEAVANPDENSLENDFLERILQCQPVLVTGNEYHSIFTVSGKVVSSAGRPVAGATVLLRESSTARISSESTKYIDVPDRHLVRSHDVFARAITDEQGWYRFEAVKSPALNRSNSWRGSVVVGHPEAGIGWQALPHSEDRLRTIDNLTVRLSPLGRIQGKFVTPHGEPQVGAVINIYQLEAPRPHPMFDGDCDLQASQLTPRATCNDKGEFEFKNLPAGFAASVGAPPHNGWLADSKSVATSVDVPLGDRGRYLSGRSNSTIVGSPFDLVADEGKRVTGTVKDEAGKPVEGATVRWSSSYITDVTDQQGRFSLRLSSNATRATGNDPRQRFQVHAPAQSFLMDQYVYMPNVDLEADEPLEVMLKSGGKIAGRVVDSAGQPLAGVQVRLQSDALVSTSTNEAGEYEIKLPSGEHWLVFYSNAPGLKLPDWRRYRGADEDRLAEFPRVRVNAVANEFQRIEAIKVERIDPYDVVVRLPDGEPAKNASVGLVDSLKLAAPHIPVALQPSRKIDVSPRAITDEQGRVRLTPQGGASVWASAEATLVAAGVTYSGSEYLSRAKNNQLVINLKRSKPVDHQPRRSDTWQVEGRVLVDGQPVSGAVVSIGEQHTFPSGSPFSGGSMTTNHQTAITDIDGKYRAPVASRRSYSVTLASVPGIDDVPRHGYGIERRDGDVLHAKTIELLRGTEQIAGIVFDSDGRPVPGAHVSIASSSLTHPDLWLGHERDSQFMTDESGVFVLRNVVRGEYSLSVTVQGPSGTKSKTAVYRAKSGATDLRLNVDTTPRPKLKRLEPKQILDN